MKTSCTGYSVDSNLDVCLDQDLVWKSSLSSFNMIKTTKSVCAVNHDDCSIGSDFMCTCCPYGRSGHRIVVSDNSVLSLGGYNPNLGRAYNEIPEEMDDRGLPLFKELWKFNLSTRQWHLFDSFSSVPPTIASHTIAKVGRWLFVFGGTSIPFGETASNSIYRFDLLLPSVPPPDSNIEAGEGAVTLSRPGSKWHLIPVDGDIPEARYGHSMTMLYPDVYIVGGTSGFEYNSEVYHLDLRSPTGRWTKLSSNSDPLQPRGRYRHETVHKDGILYILGGGTHIDAFPLAQIHTFNISSKEWGKIDTVPDPIHGHPVPRKCHSCSQFGNDVYLVGGLSSTTLSTNETTAYDDIWRFSLKDASWTKFSTTTHAPLYFHAADICPKSGCLWIFGGVNKMSNFNFRTNRLMCLRVSVGRLKELAWAVVCNSIHTRWKEVDLDELGIPLHLQARLKTR